MWTTTLWSQGGCWPIPWGVAVGVSLVAAAFDVKVRRIPNWLTGPVLAAGLAWSGHVGGVSGVADAVTAMLMCAVPYVILFAFAGGGAGDAKLMGALGAWLGCVNGVAMLAAVALSGVVLAAAYAMAARQAKPVCRNVTGFMTSLFWHIASRLLVRRGEPLAVQVPSRQKTLKVPYGLAILCGVCIAAAGVWIWRVWENN